MLVTKAKNSFLALLNSSHAAWSSRSVFPSLLFVFNLLSFSVSLSLSFLLSLSFFLFLLFFCFSSFPCFILSFPYFSYFVSLLSFPFFPLFIPSSLLSFPLYLLSFFPSFLPFHSFITLQPISTNLTPRTPSCLRENMIKVWYSATGIIHDVHKQHIY